MHQVTINMASSSKKKDIFIVQYLIIREPPPCNLHSTQKPIPNVDVDKDPSHRFQLSDFE